MRVLAMAHAYPPHHNGGAEMTLAVVLEHLASRGHTVDVLLNRDPTLAPAGLPHANSQAPTSDYTRNGVNVHLPHGTADPFRWLDSGTDLFPDVMISHLENTTRAAILADMYKIPMVHMLHNTTDHAKHCLRRGRSDLAIFNTHWMAEDYARWFKWMDLRLPPSVVIHPPVFTDRYTTTPGKKITLINLFEPKGGKLFWELARRLPQREFLGVTGAYGDQVDEGPLDNVTVARHTPPDLMKLVYGQTKVLLMPSSYESYGRTAIEASASGIPVIAHPTPGLREALGPDGIFCDRTDPDAWVAALRRLWTPKGYAASSRRALTVAARQNPLADLDLVCDRIEGAAHGQPTATG